MSIKGKKKARPVRGGGGRGNMTEAIANFIKTIDADSIGKLLMAVSFIMMYSKLNRIEQFLKCIFRK